MEWKQEKVGREKRDPAINENEEIKTPTMETTHFHSRTMFGIIYSVALLLARTTRCAFGSFSDHRFIELVT